jgi:asparagine synthase (glutamine-hydrolysing)
LRIPPNVRCHKGKVEKYLIRESISTVAPELLPPEILYRKKEAFSDGVSSLNHSWYQIIQERMESYQQQDTVYSINPPTTKEQIYYRNTFEQFYPGCAHIIPYFWMPKFVNATDASARTLALYQTET